jgi:Tol biopolymer transport system component
MTLAPSMRPGNGMRRLLPGQVSELVVASRDGAAISCIYETGELIEAPNWTPDGRWLVFNADGRLFRISPDGSEGPQRINTAPVENLNNDHVIAPGGERIFLSANDGHLYAVAVTGGVPTKVSHAVEAARGYRYYLHGISPDGATLAYVGLERGAAGKVITRIATIAADGGTVTELTDGSCPVDGPEYSPDGQWIWFNGEIGAKVQGHAQLFRMRADGSGLEQMTQDERVNWFPHVAPDGSIVAYISFPPGTLGHPADKDVIIRTMNPDGSAFRDIDAFNGGQGTINVPSWAPDSQHFAYVRYPVRTTA